MTTKKKEWGALSDFTRAKRLAAGYVPTENDLASRVCHLHEAGREARADPRASVIQDAIKTVQRDAIKNTDGAIAANAKRACDDIASGPEQKPIRNGLRALPRTKKSERRAATVVPDIRLPLEIAIVRGLLRGLGLACA